jgi:hypothetical protein
VTITDWVQAAAAVGTVIVAIAAIAVALTARDVAQDANKIAGDANKIAGDAIEIAKQANSISEDARDVARQTAIDSKRHALLAAVPHLSIEAINLVGGAAPVLKLRIRNGGPTVAYGVLASAAAAAERSISAAQEETRRQSGRKVAVPPGGELGLQIPADTLALQPSSVDTEAYTAIRVEYYGPLGGRVRQDYILLMKTNAHFVRLHQMSIDPRDGGLPVEFEITLGRFEEAD